MERAQGKSILSLVGIPAVVIQLSELPSVNAYIGQLGRHAVKGGQFEKKWRRAGHAAAENWIAEQRPKLQYVACRRDDGTTGIRLKSPLLHSNIFILYKVWKGSERLKDSALNLHTKPIEDGFTDAGLWPNDDDRYVLGKLPIYAGRAPKSKIIIEIHCLEETLDLSAHGISILQTGAAQ